MSKYGKGECDRCGFVFKLSHLRYEWSGIKVCARCWDPLPAQDFPRAITAESTALHDARPRHDKLSGTGVIRGELEIIGRSWPGMDLALTGDEATLA